MADKSKSKGNGAQKLTEYPAGQAFSGVIGRTFEVSKPAWPAPNRAKEGAPNVLFIVLAVACFGKLVGCTIRVWKLPAIAGWPVELMRPMPFTRWTPRCWWPWWC